MENQTLSKENIGAFTIGNFIRVDDNDTLTKMRLISININFSKPEEIMVEFSDMQTIRDNVSDIQDILNQASSAATSYDTIKKQYDADKNKMNYVSSLISDGLSSMLADSKNADNQEFTIGSRGILGREYN